MTYGFLILKLYGKDSCIPQLRTTRAVLRQVISQIKLFRLQRNRRYSAITSS